VIETLEKESIEKSKLAVVKDTKGEVVTVQQVKKWEELETIK
jgi:hypothetical protein